MFNYKKAWKKAAAPAFMALPSHILQLVWRVHIEAVGIHHSRNLDLRWPNEDLKSAFDALECEELSYSAHIVNRMGYWHPGYNDWLRPIQRQETYWRYSLYADQTLRKKLNIPRLSNPDGFILEIVDGLLRATIGKRREGYHSVNIGLATPQNKVKANEIWEEHRPRDEWLTEAHRLILKMKSELHDSRIIVEEDYDE